MCVGNKWNDATTLEKKSGCRIDDDDDLTEPE